MSQVATMNRITSAATLLIAALAAISTAHAEDAQDPSTSFQAEQTLDAIMPDGEIQRRSLAGYWPGSARGSASSGYAQATYYQNPFRGACGYGRDIPQYIAALSPTLFSDSSGCGACYLLECIGSQYAANACTGQTVIVRATDLCPNQGNPICVGKPHFDLNEAAFTRLGVRRAGVLRLKYTKVACPKSSSIKVKVLGSNPWWIQVVFVNANEQIMSAEVASVSGRGYGSWRKMSDSWGATFSGSGLSNGPIAFRLKGTTGKTVIVTIPGRSTGIVDCPGKNF